MWKTLLKMVLPIIVSVVVDEFNKWITGLKEMEPPKKE